MRRTKLAPILLPALLACDSDSTAPRLPDDVGAAGDGQLAAVLEHVRAAYGLPSLGATLVVEGRIIESDAVGLRAVGSSEEVTADDLWHLGSLTKAMTATVAAVQVEGGVISWETTVQDVFPDLVGVIRSEYTDVRLDELLYHTSGLPVDITQTPSWPTLRDDPSPLPEQRRRWTAEFLALEPEVSRGTYLYSNAGYIVAGSMLEEVTGKAWEGLVRDELFAPLAMRAAGFGAPGVSGLIDEPRGHVRESGSWREIEPGRNADNPAAVGPAGTVHATMSDYAAYMTAHLAGARGVSGLVSSESFQKLHTPAPGSPYSLGWGVAERDWAAGRVLQHAGSNGLWYAVVWLAPERDLGMLAVSNAGGDDAAEGTDAAVVALIRRFEAAFAAQASGV